MTSSVAERGLLLLILLTAAALRLWHIGFGLPALNDPDEPLFVMTALDMLRDGTMNPGWFGHPATVLLYALALIFVAVGSAGFLIGRWDTADGFVSALYAHPEMAILPMRMFIAACGVACVYLTYRIGRRTIGPRAGLLAAALLAGNALHMEYSQIIRTDMLASVFMLLCTLYALRVAETGRGRDQMLAGAMAGLACATKWPAAVVLANALAAAAMRRSPRLAAIALASAAGALIAASPFLILDYPTVLRDLGGEARPVHLGATGGSPLDNLGWYLGQVLVPTFGPVGVALVLAGVPLAVWRRWGGPVLPGALAFLIAIVAQALVWERWAVPLLPFAALLAALTCARVAERLPRRAGPVAAAATLLALLVPALIASHDRARMRADDTRQAATAWVRRHVPADASILIEHAGFDLLDRRGALLFPLGTAGCIDVHRALSGKPQYRSAAQARSGRAIVDLGNLPAERLPGCRADYAILSHRARYAAEPDRFAAELGRYRTYARHGRVVATFAPVPGRRGGPVVEIVRF